MTISRFVTNYLEGHLLIISGSLEVNFHCLPNCERSIAWRRESSTTKRHAAEMLIAVSLFPCLGYGQQSAAPSVPTGPESPVSFCATLSKQEKQHILDGRCNVIGSTSSMPKSLKDGFAKVTRQRSFKLADPHKEVPGNRRENNSPIASRRLVLAGSCEDRWFVHYEHGGIGLSYAVMIFRADSNGVLQFEWGGSGFYPAKSIGKLRLANFIGEIRR